VSGPHVFSFFPYLPSFFSVSLHWQPHRSRVGVGAPVATAGQVGGGCSDLAAPHRTQRAPRSAPPRRAETMSSGRPSESAMDADVAPSPRRSKMRPSRMSNSDLSPNASPPWIPKRAQARPPNVRGVRRTRAHHGGHTRGRGRLRRGPRRRLEDPTPTLAYATCRRMHLDAQSHDCPRQRPKAQVDEIFKFLPL
jgi:hypothetical protein